MSNILLHSTQGGSDKVYLLKAVRNEKNPDLFDVVYANGRRSSGATAGNKKKNSYPMSFASATSLMYDLAQEKRDTKGYHEMGGCSLCGGTQAVVNTMKEISKAGGLSANPDVEKLKQKELVKTYAPTWYERTVMLDENADL